MPQDHEKTPSAFTGKSAVKKEKVVPDKLNWEKLAQEAQKGNKNAYNRLLHEVIPYIRGILVPRITSKDWVEDIIQEVLISVHKSLHTYSADRPFKPWLFALIQYRKSDFLRKVYKKKALRQRYINQHRAQTGTDNVTNQTTAGEYKDIERILLTIPEDQRTIFEMLKIRGYTAKEVADQMGMSESAVKVSAHRTLKRLRRLHD